MKPLPHFKKSFFITNNKSKFFLLILGKPKFVTSTPDQKKDSSTDHHIDSNPECDMDGDYFTLIYITD